MRSSGHGPTGGEDFDAMVALGYDTRDVQTRPLIVGMAGLFALIAGASIAILLFYNFFAPRYVEERALPAFVTARKLPPNPQVQVNPKRDMIEYHAAIDARAGAIERAKRDAAAAGISGVGDAPKTPGRTSFPGSGDFHGGAGGERAGENR